MVSKLRFGILGYNEGNGHPFSFGSIINGYDSHPLRAAGWNVIADYLDKQDPHEVGLDGVSVSNVWAPQTEIATALSATIGSKTVNTPTEMIQHVDAVIIARDDWESHIPLALPFLEAGKFVLIDKPLTLDRSELEQFIPYLLSGHLMSCSALRYARELDPLRAKPDSIGKMQSITGVVVLGFERYGIHLLEAVCGVLDECPSLVHATRIGETDVGLFSTLEGVPFSLHALGKTHKRFRLSFYGDMGSFEVDISDNFSAFRRCIQHFVTQIRSGQPAIPPEQTLAIVDSMITFREEWIQENV